MALPLDKSVDRFRSNEVRANYFINGPDDGGYTATDGTFVPSVRNISKRLTLDALQFFPGKSFGTYAEAEASGLPNGALVMVTDDGQRNGYYRVAEGALEPTELQPARQSDVVEGLALSGQVFSRSRIGRYPSTPDSVSTPSTVQPDMTQVDGVMATVLLARENDVSKRVQRKRGPSMPGVAGEYGVTPTGVVADGPSAMARILAEIDALESGAGLRFVKNTTGVASLYFKGNGGDNWIELGFQHQVHPQGPPFVQASNSDLWRIVEAFETDGEFNRLYGGLPIVNSGEWECALREPTGSGGVPVEDAVGGYHGDELLSDAFFLIDGVRRPVSWTGNVRPRTLEFVQHSTIYRYHTNTPIALHTKHYVFDATGFRLTQRLEWLVSTTLTYGMVGMLPIKRVLQDTAGPAITEYAMRSPGLTVEDVRTAGFPITYTQDTQSAQIWGESSGISARLEILPGTRLPGSRFYVANGAAYNKFYWDVGYNAAPQVGDVWDVDLRFTLNTSN